MTTPVAQLKMGDVFMWDILHTSDERFTIVSEPETWHEDMKTFCVLHFAGRNTINWWTLYSDDFVVKL